MIGKLLQREVDDLPVLTLTCVDEKAAPYPSQNKRTRVREEVPKEAFHGGRNFK
jgi:error-prone DNA polymerase